MRVITRRYLLIVWAALGVLLAAAVLLRSTLGEPTGGFLVRTMTILWAEAWLIVPFVMRGFTVQYLREVRSFFLGPVAYVCMAVFLTVTGFVFYAQLNYRALPLVGVIWWSGLALTLVVPILTMRLLAAEKSIGTFEALMTDPVTDFEVVFAKFYAAMTVVVAMLVPHLIYVLILSSFGQPDLNSIYSGYLGLLCVAATMVAIGIFLSSLVSSQAVCAIVGVITLFLLYVVAGWFLDQVAPVSPAAREFLEPYLSPGQHLSAFGVGQVSSRILVYYASLTALFLFFTTRSVEARKWR